jgi:hypothetical protein
VSDEQSRVSIDAVADGLAAWARAVLA